MRRPGCAAERPQRHAGLDARHHVLGVRTPRTASSRDRSRTRSSRARRAAEALARCRAPRGADREPLGSSARASTRLTSFRRAGRTTQRGTTPSTAAALEPPSPRRGRARGRRGRRARRAARARDGSRYRAQTQVPVGQRAEPPGRNPSPHAGCDGRSLPGIHDARRDRRRRRSRYMKFRSASRVLQRQALRLVETDAVLAGHAAAEAQARRQQLLVGLLGALELARHPVVVAGSAGAGCRRRRGTRWRSRRPVARADGLHLAHDLGQLRARHHARPGAASWA